ncbi:MAG: mevalonate kinase [Candidatus Thermoplasmatota archaeon]
MVKVSAPGMVILFGEYAVRYGEPALAVAVDLRTTCTALPSRRVLINDAEPNKKRDAYVLSSIVNGWAHLDRKVAVWASSALPTAAGMGYSAALCVASVGAMRALEDAFVPEDIAERAFEAEYGVQDSSIPIDTSASAHGAGVLISMERVDGYLWTVTKGRDVWHLHHRDVPNTGIVVGDTGIQGSAAAMASKVGRFVQRNAFARELVKEIGEIAVDGARALDKGDVEMAGRLMERNHKLLVTLGAGHPALDKLVRAVKPHSYGAKLMSEGGGSIVALTEHPERVAAAIEGAGGTAYVLSPADTGVRIDEGRV